MLLCYCLYFDLYGIGFSLCTYDANSFRRARADKLPLQFCSRIWS